MREKESLTEVVRNVKLKILFLYYFDRLNPKKKKKDLKKEEKKTKKIRNKPFFQGERKKIQLTHNIDHKHKHNINHKHNKEKTREKWKIF